jgi:hypothetical protein
VAAKHSGTGPVRLVPGQIRQDSSGAAGRQQEAVGDRRRQQNILIPQFSAAIWLRSIPWGIFRGGGALVGGNQSRCSAISEEERLQRCIQGEGTVAAATNQ